MEAHALAVDLEGVAIDNSGTADDVGDGKIAPDERSREHGRWSKAPHPRYRLKEGGRAIALSLDQKH